MSKITNHGLTRSATGCFKADVPIWQHYNSRRLLLKHEPPSYLVDIFCCQSVSVRCSVCLSSVSLIVTNNSTTWQAVLTWCWQWWRDVARVVYTSSVKVKRSKVKVVHGGHESCFKVVSVCRTWASSVRRRHGSLCVYQTTTLWSCRTASVLSCRRRWCGGVALTWTRLDRRTCW